MRSESESAKVGSTPHTPAVAPTLPPTTSVSRTVHQMSLTVDQLFGVGHCCTADSSVAVASSVPAGADAALHADKDQLLVTVLELFHQVVHTLGERVQG